MNKLGINPKILQIIPRVLDVIKKTDGLLLSIGGYKQRPYFKSVLLVGEDAENFPMFYKKYVCMAPNPQDRWCDYEVRGLDGLIDWDRLERLIISRIKPGEDYGREICN